MHVNAIDQALEGYASGNTEVEATLKDGSVVRGRIMNFDGYVIFMDGGSGQMVYRHSLLKIAQAKAARAPEAKAQPQPQSTGKPRHDRLQAKPDARSNPQQQKSNRPPKPKPQERRPQVETQEDTGRIGSMGEAMQKWLQSQKG